ncbi:uncharacterized protein EDB91DRAFT_1250425 [Suillus paluster]|uniref:uncharacterized protein n=1 Tax=Suillus paluster TaxID=48578 RepID=UPI001B8682DE|nr:uncharacterized protein EDB91DRAFT_1250425 [Suillus paluster]KAG1735594.1 hypothetical protein EDB91DRAFT_1250425 [Suillus paluster]
MAVSMSEDDVAYTALLRQLLSDTSSTRNARVHSWIEHQYDFALSEADTTVNKDRDDVSLGCSRAPSPSPSSSLGAHRTFYSDRPDSPLLPRSSAECSSQGPESCPSYDALFFPVSSSPQTHAEDEVRDERERERALRFLVQEMSHWKMQSSPTTPRKNVDKPLPCPPPPSPATSTTQSTSSRVMRSRSSSTRISRLPSFTSTLESDQSQPQDIFTPPLPVSVIVHGEAQHELIPDLRSSDSFFLRRMDSFKMNEQDEQELSLLSPIHDDRDSGYPSPTLSNFSYAPSRETALTSPYASLPTSPASATFAPCLPENIALPASPDANAERFPEESLSSEDRGGDSSPKSPSDTAFPVSASTTVFPLSSSSTVFPVSPSTTIFPASAPDFTLSTSPSLTVDPATPSSSHFPLESKDCVNDFTAQSQRLRASTNSSGDLQSRWSVATTASLTPSPSDPAPSGTFLRSRTPSRGKKDKEVSKEVKTPRKRTRLISFISKLSPGRSESNATSTTGSPSADYDFANESDTDERVYKPSKTLGKKSSLASLRASFSLSRASFASQRPPVSSVAEIPPLPMSPTRTSFGASRMSFATDGVMGSGEPVPPVPTISLSRIPSRATLLDDTLPPIPQSASTVTSFRSVSQASLQTHTPPSASASQLSLLPSPSASHSASRLSLLLASSSSRNSLVSSAALEPPISIHPMPSSTPSRAKSIFKLSSRPKTPKVRAVATPSKLPLPRMGAVSSSSIPNGASLTASKIPPPPTKFTPPSKLASMLASQASSRLPHPISPNSPPTSKLPPPPSKMITPPPKIIVPTRMQILPQASPSVIEPKSPMSIDEPIALVSKLPLPSISSKASRTSTVRGFWRRAQ